MDAESAEATEDSSDHVAVLDGRYRIIEPLARGGMSTVWRARDERLQRPVAVKLLHRDLNAHTHSRARLRWEAEALARLTHPHIASVYDFGTSTAEPVTPYLVLELVEGPCLATVLEEQGPLPWRVAADVCAQIASALAQAHARGVVHRDVTAANVVITATGAKLIDFGICAIEGQPDSEPDGNLRCTPAYTAPERFDGQPVRPAADVYSLGVLLYRAIAGRLPWQASESETTQHFTVDPLDDKADSSAAQVELFLQQRREPHPLPELDDLPAEVAQLCLRCLAYDPAARPAAADVALALNAAVGPASAMSPSALRVSSARRPTTRILPLSAVPTARQHIVPARSRRQRLVRPLAVGALLIVIALVGWLAPGWAGVGGSVPTRAYAPGATLAIGDACAVTYQVTRSNPDRFAALITVANTSQRPISDWQLAFELPDRRQIDAGPGGMWRQEGNTVTSLAQPALSPGGKARLPVAGNTAGRSAPMNFTLDARDCQSTVLAAKPTDRPAYEQKSPPGQHKKRGRDKNGNNHD